MMASHRLRLRDRGLPTHSPIQSDTEPPESDALVLVSLSAQDGAEQPMQCQGGGLHTDQPVLAQQSNQHGERQRIPGHGPEWLGKMGGVGAEQVQRNRLRANNVRTDQDSRVSREIRAYGRAARGGMSDIWAEDPHGNGLRERD